MSRLLLIPTILMLGVALLVLSPRMGHAQEGDEVPEALAAAMDQYIADRGEQSAGNCADTVNPDDIGMWCWEVVSMSNTTATVDFGPTFSHFTNRATFEEANGSWSVAEDEPIPGPGETGTGLAPSSGNGLALPAAFLGALLVAGGLGAIAVAHARRR